MDQIIRELDEAARKRPLRLKEAKKHGKKIIQYTGSFIPVEMIYAAGAEPYLMCRGGESEPSDAVLEYMLRFINPLARSMAVII
jgi:benzoyl-CoA reductase/2-hydroxyglutaryl-CoA dehydratase subunit BcrC/BadD/HgdB